MGIPLNQITEAMRRLDPSGKLGGALRRRPLGRELERQKQELRGLA